MNSIKNGMTVKDYLNQGYRLEHLIKMHQEEIERLRELSCSCGSPSLEEHYNPNPNTKSPFESIIIKIADMEMEEKMMLMDLLKLKQEIKQVIDSLDNVDERLVLHYRYIDNMSWTEISNRLYCDRKTIRRFHENGLNHVKLPAMPTIINPK